MDTLIEKNLKELAILLKDDYDFASEFILDSLEKGEDGIVGIGKSNEMWGGRIHFRSMLFKCRFSRSK